MPTGGDGLFVISSALQTQIHTKFTEKNVVECIFVYIALHLLMSIQQKHAPPLLYFNIFADWEFEIIFATKTTPQKKLSRIISLTFILQNVYQPSL